MEETDEKISEKVEKNVSGEVSLNNLCENFYYFSERRIHFVRIKYYSAYSQCH